MDLKCAPIAVIAYNRVDNLKAMFASLRNCRRFEESPVCVFVDGPKDQEDAKKVNEVRAYAESLSLPNVSVVCRKVNVGLKGSVFTGASKLCAEYGRVIVLEDDLILSEVALEYFNQALDFYAEESRVWSVVGYQYDAQLAEQTDKALLLPFAHSWGWATWKRAWHQFDIKMDVDERDLSSKVFTSFFDLCGVRDFRDMLSLAKQKYIDSWFILWYYTIFKERGVSLFPPKSYVQNIGMNAGTHSSSLSPYSLLVKPRDVSDELCELPSIFKVDYWAVDIIRSCWDARVQRWIGKMGRLKRILMLPVGK